MFTGIIEEIGRIERIDPGANSIKLQISAKLIFSDLKLGDSVSTNGVCLTVSKLSSNSFTADVMPETLKKSSLGGLSVLDYVNLERAMPANGRFGGHIVSGHIDDTGTILSITKDDNALVIEINASEDILRYVIPKGSIAIDGISLTIAKRNANSFSVSIIPHTAGLTTLTTKKVGATVNLEVDMIGKYIEQLLAPARQTKQNDTLSYAFLAEHGFGG